MALTQQQLKFVTDLMTLSAQLKKDLNDSEDLKARWFLNSFSGILDADLAAASNPTTNHLTQAKLASAVTALSTFLTAMGDDVSGQQTNWIKLQG